MEQGVQDYNNIVFLINILTYGLIGVFIAFVIMAIYASYLQRKLNTLRKIK